MAEDDDQPPSKLEAEWLARTIVADLRSLGRRSDALEASLSLETNVALKELSLKHEAAFQDMYRACIPLAEAHMDGTPEFTLAEHLEGVWDDKDLAKATDGPAVQLRQDIHDVLKAGQIEPDDFAMTHVTLAILMDIGRRLNKTVLSSYMREHGAPEVAIQRLFERDDRHPAEKILDWLDEDYLFPHAAEKKEDAPLGPPAKIIPLKPPGQ